jgi:1-acyl-sn-glycerol-3-phosphate acyltransferase
MRQFLFQKVFRFVMRLIGSIEIIGLENVPDKPTFAIASNHVGRLDIGLVFVGLDRTDFILPLAEKYKKNPFTRFVGYMMGAIWLDRYNTDFKAIREMMTRIKQGGVLVIAPEGTRSKTGALQEGKPGMAFLAAKAGLSILPAALIGSDDRLVVDNLLHLRRSHFKLIAGEPFVLTPLKSGSRDEQIKEHSDEIMCHIAALLPEEKRGVYSNHPRLMALLEEQKEPR